ncbi:transposase [Mucilaginibacter terrae]|uniref:Transposase n=1 Tax=Mucilaginibacter terrae TaxID=1955052 RepID=A0ABU3GZD8_9SPHI|nr:transposase [Mucilaginibacter terrae]MDT3405134.1 putative transposase [Mucilaginibacter terrae]
MQLDTIYFYTASILNWIPLLQEDKFKFIVLDSLIHLVEKRKLEVYGFVIMPNHIHIIWKNIALNGKEMPYASFMKFTSHQFQKELRTGESSLLERFAVERNNRDYQFWQRNSLPIELYSRGIFEQKLDYIHLNPLQAHWNLVTDPTDYLYSSASFYEKEDRHYSWLTDYRDVI